MIQQVYIHISSEREGIENASLGMQRGAMFTEVYLLKILLKKF